MRIVTLCSSRVMIIPSSKCISICFYLTYYKLSEGECQSSAVDLFAI